MNLMWDYERRKKDVNRVSLWDVDHLGISITHEKQ